MLGLVLGTVLLVHARRENLSFEEHLKALAQGYLAIAEQALSRRVQDYAWWDEAVEHIGAPDRLDTAWAERNIGADNHVVLGIDGAYVLDRNGAVLFASHSDEEVRTEDHRALTVFAHHARLGQGRPPRPAAGILLVDGQLHLAAATPLTVFDTERPPPVAPSNILVFTSPLSEALAPAAKLERWFGHLVPGKSNAEGLSIPLTGIDGRPLGSLAWTAERPGTAFLWVSLPTLALGLLVMGVVIDRLWRRVREHATALELRNDALTESERRFQALVRAVPVGLFRTDGQGQCSYVNDRCTRFARLADEQSDGLLFLRAAHPEDRARVAILWHDAVLRGESFQAELRTTAADGEVCWVAVEAQPQYNDQGMLVGFLGSIADITALKRAQEELTRREELLRGIADGVPALIGYIDADGIYRFHNTRIEDWYGVPVPKVVGRPVRAVLGEDLYARLKPQFDAAFAGRAVMTAEEQVRLGNGPERTLSIQGIPHRNAQGAVAGLFVLSTDVTERHRIERELAEARDRAEAANHAKTRFLAAASHDLRQPLHALGLFLDLLANKELAPPQRELLDRARQSFQGTEELLSLLLDISRLEAGAVEPNVGPVDLPDLFERLEAQFALEAGNRGLRLRFHPLPENVVSDGVLLERVLRNLVTNALRYTEAGGVLIGCRRVGRFARIEVWDTGSGIAPEQLDHIFEEFYQVGNPERDARRGLGLGLAIVNRVAQLLGHPVAVRSRVGRGSVFSISVPLADEAVKEPEHAEGPDAGDALERLAGHRVAVVDDNPQALAALRHFLEALDIEAVAAETGEALIEALAEGGAPDAIIADLRLRGGVDGTDVIAEVRQIYGRNLPGLLLTGDTAPERVRQAVDSGNDLLHKPVRPEALIDALTRALLPVKPV
ncbi:PAS domain-containing protein [Azospirillum soli]|uniref:PAS domain-containing protein n=1 Tax=Azospirillum soli TaxID=1304799 RepID=UPI001AE8D630|nr:PAS domain-containing protein [Azospirillum soli]MBP2315321.1 PAS domain S-box-containing protein [Azospirillum soli]